MIGSIEGKLATLQATQQKLQADSSGAVTEQMVEDAKQVAAQCTAEVAVIRVELRSPCLPSDSRASHDVCVGGLLGMGSPKDSFGDKSPCLYQIL